MYAKTIAISGALAALAAAVPMAKRDVVWVTQTAVDMVTVPVTTTLWVDPTDVPVHYGHQHSHWTPSHPASSAPSVSAPAAPSSTEAAPSSYETPASSSTEVAPVSTAETSSSSVYVAPTTSSVYVAPTTSTSVYVAPTTSTSVYVAPTTSTSVYVAPTTSTSVYVAPSTTSVYAAPTTSSVYVAPTTTETPSSTSAAPPAYSSSSSGSGDGVTGMGAPGTWYEGDLTYFAVGLGACGNTSTEADHMVAVSEKIFDSYLSEAGGNPNNVAICGKYVTITGVDGNPYKAQIMDRCPGCDEGSLDLPETFFNTVTYDPSTKKSGDGRVHNIKWEFD
jgi:hypothetical protein